MTTLIAMSTTIMAMDTTTTMIITIMTMMMTISHFVHALIVQMMTMTTDMTIAMEMETLLQKENLYSQIGLFKSWFQVEYSL